MLVMNLGAMGMRVMVIVIGVRVEMKGLAEKTNDDSNRQHGACEAF